MAAWREALDLLPADSRQFQVIAEKITELGRNPASIISPPTAPTEQKGLVVRTLAGVGAIGLLAWKLKSLLLGLTKGTTLFSMLLSLGVYWTAWGWQFALGIILSIYVHEMGHVMALHRYGFKATAPMFIPGLGALIRLQQKVVNPREDADIGLAGPIYGLGAAATSWILWLTTGQPIFAAVAGVGAWINLFNLLPIGSLDGGRGFHALSRSQKFLVALAAVGAWFYTQDGLIILLALISFGRAIVDKSEDEGCWRVAVTFGSLIFALSAMSLVRLQSGLEV